MSKAGYILWLKKKRLNDITFWAKSIASVLHDSSRTSGIWFAKVTANNSTHLELHTEKHKMAWTTIKHDATTSLLVHFVFHYKKSLHQ